MIMKATDYDAKIAGLLGDDTTYKKLERDPTKVYKSKLVNTMKEWKRTKTISDALYYRIYPTSEAVPKFYRLPKVHKNNVPLRPIVSSIGSITYKTAKFLASILSPLVGKTEHFVKNSTQFVKKIKELEVPPGRKMVSFVVTALFTSIPVTEAVSVIKDRLNQDTTLKDRCELSVNQIITLLKICLNTTYFIYDGVFYKQKKGAAMGSPVSPIVANLTYTWNILKKEPSEKHLIPQTSG